jgi:hypothetical protein
LLAVPTRTEELGASRAAHQATLIATLPIYCPVSTYLYDSTILIKGIRSVDDRLELPGLHQLPEIRDLVPGVLGGIGSFPPPEQ